MSAPPSCHIRHLLCWALSLVLAASLIPSWAIAVEAQSADAAGETLGADAASTQPTTATDAGAPNTERTVAQLSVGAEAEGAEASAILCPETRNTTTGKITLNWDAAGEADSATVTATMTYLGKTTRTVTHDFNRKGTTASDTFDFDYTTYGKFTVSAQFKKDGSNVGKPHTAAAAVVADTYNIAPVSATLPVTFFSLNLWGAGNMREEGPVILLMERPNAYDWDNLPDNMYGLPYFTEEEIQNQPDVSKAGFQFIAREQTMADYVADLLALDPTSHINLYCVDYYVDLIQRVIYANKVPADQYRIVVISDGSYTYSVFKSTYERNGKTPEANHKDLVSEWNADKAYAYANGKPAAKYFKSNGEATYGFGYLFWAAIDSDPNAEMWVARKDLLQTSTDGGSFAAKVQASEKLKQPSISSLLEANIKSSARNTAEFKALYNFNDSYFADAEAVGKDVMVLLGSRVGLEQTFENYARFVQAYYGDAYAYYYKGHPATPTGSSSEKQAQLKRLGVTDVDSSIAAELILFFNPEIYLSGYASSTYASVPEGMGKGMFNMTKAAGSADVLYRNMEFWMSMVGDATPAAVTELCVAGHENYLVEFNDSVVAKKGYDIAIWDATASTITYYRLGDDGVYRNIEGNVVAPGVYVFQSVLKSDAVLDVLAASTKSGANVQLYSYNATPAQLWRVTFDTQGRATIANVKSGLPLSVATSRLANKANICQRSGSATAQKWLIRANDNGTYTLCNAQDPSFAVDVTGAETADGTNIQLFADDNVPAQQFNILPCDPVIGANQADLPSGFYRFRSQVNRAFALDLDAYNRANGANLHLWEDALSANQLLQIERLDNGYYHITSAWNGKGVDVDRGGVLPDTNVHFWDSAKASPIQQWAIFDAGDGTYRFQNVASGLYLDIQGGRARNGANVVVNPSKSGASQRWALEAQSDPRAKLDALAAKNRSALPDGTYTVASAKSPRFVLDVWGGSRRNGANVWLYQTNSTPAQVWTVSHDKQGYITLKSKVSGKVLDVAAGLPRSWTNVQQYSANGTYAQKWIAIKQSNGTYKLASALYPDLVLDVARGKAASGSNIQLFENNDTAAQRFRFMPVG